MEFLVGGVAATSAGIFTNPIEVVKHHMELNKKEQVTNDHGKYKGFLDAGYKVAKKDGIRSLQKGLSPALGAHLTCYGTKLGTYHFGQNRGFTSDIDGNVMVAKSISTSAVGGLLGQYMSSPFYLLKIQHEIDNMNAKTKKGYIHTLIKMYKDHGIRGFFRGTTASLPRAVIGTSQLTSFALAKENMYKFEFFKQKPLATTLLASTIAGIVLTICMTPFDMVLTKLYKQAISPVVDGPVYKNFLDCAKKTYKANGLRPFYTGMGSLYLKLGPHTILCLTLWEELKVFSPSANVNNDSTSFYKKLGFIDDSFQKYGSYNQTLYDLDELNDLDDIHETHKCDVYWN